MDWTLVLAIRGSLGVRGRRRRKAGQIPRQNTPNKTDKTVQDKIVPTKGRVKHMHIN